MSKLMEGVLNPNNCKEGEGSEEKRVTLVLL
jgi:hypothetical protein